MKISVFFDHLVEASAQTRLPIIEVMAKVRATGVVAVDCSLERALEPEFVALLKATDLRVASIYAFFDCARGSEPSRASALLERAQLLGAPSVLAIPGFIPEATDPTTRGDILENMVAALEALCDNGRRQTIDVTLENFDDTRAPYCTLAGLVWFLERIPALRCTFDVGNFAYSEDDELIALNSLLDRVIHVHCKDRSQFAVPGGDAKHSIGGRPLFASAVGDGFMRMGKIVEQLGEIGYTGYYSIEHFGLPDQLVNIKRSAEWLLARAESERP